MSALLVPSHVSSPARSQVAEMRRRVVRNSVEVGLDVLRRRDLAALLEDWPDLHTPLRRHECQMEMEGIPIRAISARGHTVTY